MESEQTHRILERDFDFPKNPVFVVYRSKPGAFPDSDLAESVLNQLESVTALSEVASITTFRDDLGQVSPDGSVAYAIVAIDLPDVGAHRALPKLRQALRNDQVEVVLTGGPVFYADIQEVSESDLRRAELITLPLAFVVLVIVFGSLISAGLPVLIGGIAVVVSLAGLAALSGLSDQSIFALNLVTMLGLGLGADYSLLIVDRFREELGQHSVRGGGPPDVGHRRPCSAVLRPDSFAGNGDPNIFPLHVLQVAWHGWSARNDAGLSYGADITSSAHLPARSSHRSIRHSFHACQAPAR